MLSALKWRVVAEQIATLALASSSSEATQEAGVQSWLQSAVAQLRHTTERQHSQSTQDCMRQEQAMIDAKVSI